MEHYNRSEISKIQSYSLFRWLITPICIVNDQLKLLCTINKNDDRSASCSTPCDFCSYLSSVTYKNIFMRKEFIPL